MKVSICLFTFSFGLNPKFKCLEVCPRIVDPVCGTDNKNYDNYCLLQRKACETGQNIQLASSGKCKYHCPKSCSREYFPVCGPDLKTYSNRCEFWRANCNQGTEILHEGSCLKPECPLECPKDYDPVCGNDDNSYSNKCQLRMAACDGSHDLEVAYKGECNDNASPCFFKCFKNFRPVCTEDNKTHGNMCLANWFACVNGFEYDKSAIKTGSCSKINLHKPSIFLKNSNKNQNNKHENE